MNITEETKEELNRLSKLTVFFGHQSVGMDILTGVEELYKASGLPEYPVTDVGDGAAIGGPGIYHLFAGKNGDPVGKCSAFESTMYRLFPGAGPDVAFLKFCYADFRDSVEQPGLVSSYTSTIARLKARYPATRFIYLTVPVTSRSAWWKRMIRSLLGKEDPSDAAAVIRHGFNQSLIKEAGRDQVFDLAEVESTKPDGTRVLFEYQGKPAAMLVDSYTYDGGHLNEEGRLLAAKALVHFVTSSRE